MLFLLASFLGFAQVQEYSLANDYKASMDELFSTAGITSKNINTGILYDRAISLSGLHKFEQKDTVDRDYFYQALLELRLAAYDETTFPENKDIWDIEDYYLYGENMVPIAILFSRFNFVDVNAYKKELISKDEISEKEVFLVALLDDKKTLKSQTTFILPSSLILGNQTKALQSIEIDFGDGAGYRDIKPDVPVRVTYTTKGDFNITARVIDNGYPVYESIAKSKVGFPVGKWGPYEMSSNDIAKPITAQYAYLGIKGQGLVTYLYHNTNKKLNKPVVIIDGFDPGDKRDAETIFKLFEDKNRKLATKLYNAGYDLVILDFPKYTVNRTKNIFDPNIDGPEIIIPIDEIEVGGDNPPPITVDGGADYIQRNAFVLVELLEQLNSQLNENNSQEELVIVGPSMGGLVSRYALTWMEQNNKNHNTRLWLTVDSPHQGANISIGAQHFLSFFKDVSSSAKEALTTQINSRAARQMLIHHHNANSETPLPDPVLGNAWQNEIETLGYPQNLRKSAISNGSLNGTPTFQPGKLALELAAKLKSGTTVERGYIYTTTGYGNRQKVFNGIHWNEGSSTEKFAKGLNASYSLDNSPGGTFSTFKKIMDEAGNGAHVHIQLLGKVWVNFDWRPKTESHSFIPTKSSLDFNGSNPDLKENLSNRNLVVTKEIPFQNYWAPVGSNMEHATFNKDLEVWIMGEILNYPLPYDFKLPDEVLGSGVACQGTWKDYHIELPNVATFPSGGFSVSWTHSPNLIVRTPPMNSSLYNSIEVKSIEPNGEGWIEAEIQLNGVSMSTIRKDLWVGKPIISFDPPGATVNPDSYNTVELVYAPVAIPLKGDYWDQYVTNVVWTKSGEIRSVGGNMQNGHYFTGSRAGSGKVMATAHNGCGSSMAILLVVVMDTGTDHPGPELKHEQIIVSPNPASEFIDINSITTDTDFNQWQISIISPTGIPVLTKMMQMPNSISIKGLQPGIYTLIARKGEYTEQHKIVIQK